MIYAISSLITAVLSIALGLFVVIKNYKEKQNQVWFLTSVAIFVWTLGLFWTFVAKNSETALLWQKILYVGTIFIPITFFHYSVILTELDKIETGNAMDVFPIFNDLAFQTVVKSLFSSAVGEKEISRLQYITEATQKMLVKELRQPYLGWWFQLGGSIKHHVGLTQEAREILKTLVTKRKSSGKREGDLLDMLLDARYEDGNAMEEEQLIDEILILFTAGHETTSNALTFTAELLARDPDSQDKIADEVEKATQNTNGLFEFIQACPFTKNVIEESMRLYPPAYFIDRVNIEDDEFNGMFIPKNSNLLFSMYEIHRHPDLWEEPERFMPERFADGNLQKHSSHYFPFGAGPRMCIGNNFAMYEMILAITALIKKYRISAESEKIAIHPLITLKPKNAFLEFKIR